MFKSDAEVGGGAIGISVGWERDGKGRRGAGMSHFGGEADERAAGAGGALS